MPVKGMGVDVGNIPTGRSVDGVGRKSHDVDVMLLDYHLENNLTTPGYEVPGVYPWERKIESHLAVMAYYGKFGMLDPTNVADIPMWKKAGFSTKAAFGLMSARAILGGAIVGWILDPHDKRPGGLWEETGWKKGHSRFQSKRTNYGSRII